MLGSELQTQGSVSKGCQLTPLFFLWTKKVLNRLKGNQMRIYIISMVLVLLATISRAEAPDHLGSKDAFELWTGCDPVQLIVDLQKNDAPDLYLTREQIEIAVRSRLRSARVFTEDEGFPFLFVLVAVVDNAFSIDVLLVKLLTDGVYSNHSWGGSSWKTDGIGTHTNDANYILSSVSQNIDEFLDEYLRVNAASC